MKQQLTEAYMTSTIVNKDTARMKEIQELMKDLLAKAFANKNENNLKEIKEVIIQISKVSDNLDAIDKGLGPMSRFVICYKIPTEQLEWLAKIMPMMFDEKITETSKLH